MAEILYKTNPGLVYFLILFVTTQQLCLLVDCRHQFEVSSNAHDDPTPVPIIIWHGMGDTCCNPLSMGAIKKIFERNIPGVNVTSLQIGNNFIEDFKNSYLMPINRQIDLVCYQLQQDPSLLNGYNAVGFSQGGLLIRGLAERCPEPPMRNLISIMGPHQGVYGLPSCPTTSKICDDVRHYLNRIAYVSWLQKSLVQAQYWHNPLDEQIYRDGSDFLADINNEKNKKEEYKANLIKLNNLVLVMALNDTVLIPKESELFGFYKADQSNLLYQLQDSPLYQEDWIGLQTLDAAGRLHLLSKEGDHLQIEEQWLIDSIIEPFLKPK